MRTTQEIVGSVKAIWRYPVKSMQGEELTTCEVTPLGFLGDRAYALVDETTGKIGSAKNPRLWPGLLDFHARFLEPTARDNVVPPTVEFTDPDGNRFTSRQRDVDRQLSERFGRPVRLESSAPESPVLQQFWPDLDGDQPEQVTDEPMPSRTFFDLSTVMLMTTATLSRLQELQPESRFVPRRFRPNLLLETDLEVVDFVEDQWVGGTLRLGSSVELSVTQSCPRCVMTTLPQHDLPRDTRILKTVARHNAGNAGVSTGVRVPGSISEVDLVILCRPD